ncbi:MAG TPA: FAD-binding and (Fe-S)-binding domain-containing protein [Pseudolabrys sp.]|nr:FAD-binding and (Fe-S)-binding domain-containing protein [Pseudolabrys sp.]
MSHVIEVNHKASAGASLQHFVKRAVSGRVVTASSVQERKSFRALGTALAKKLEGEVRFDEGARALYATDASNYRQVPIGVVLPRNIADVIATIDLCRQYGAPVVARGGGTSLAGQGCNVAVLIDFSKYMHRVLSIDAVNKLAIVEPGCILDHLRDAAEQHHLTFGPDPATHDHNTLGGMLGNNSCGVHSVMAGRTSDNVESLDILTYDGTRMTVGRTSDEEFQNILAQGGRRAEIYRALDDFRRKYGDLIRARYPQIPRRVSGYENLEQLLPENGFHVARALVGTEATCVMILQAELNLVPSPRERVLTIIGFKDVFEAADAVPAVLKHKPIGCEGIDDLLIDFITRKHLHPDDLKMLPKGNGWLVVQFGADSREEAEKQAKAALDEFKSSGHDAKLIDDDQHENKIWELREAALSATAHVPDWPEGHPGWEDSAVSREDLGNYLRDLKKLFHRHGYDASVYGHFGDGLVHCRVDFDLATEKGLRSWRHFLDEAADLIVKYGGTLSGEHGDGQARAELLEKMYGPEMVQAFREFKAIWDPENKMNPGKIVDPYPIVSNLRLGPEFDPIQYGGHFAYPEDGGSFTQAMRRCVGVGKCRRRDSDQGVMCPSYMATNEEKHSTRGRARLLFEMMRGEALTDLWRSREVEEALDLCFACKACKSDCPVHVDMATYKAEFRSQHYRGRLRPRAAYSMGLVQRWARYASWFPGLANAVGSTALAKWIGDIAPQRRVPPFAKQTFRSWHRKRKDAKTGGRRVVLFPDTFNNFFKPQTAIAATRVLEAAGFEVAIPDRILCCGRPLYDWGRIDKAKALWRQTLETLREDIAAGTPLIGLEPACVSAFRDELIDLFPDDERAKRLSEQTLFFTEFLDRNNCALPRIDGSALVQLHCHHHAIIKPTSEQNVLKKLGIEFEVMASGCCGMAGSLGFEAAKYDVSIRAAERVLLPKVREAAQDTVVLANGFSCREQIEQTTDRRPQHIAELIADHLGVAQ